MTNGQPEQKGYERGNGSRTPCHQGSLPGLDAIFSSHGNYGGHRAPRDHTISFRLQGARGRFRSNVVWLMPNWMSSLTPANIKAMVAEANGKRK